MVGVEAIGVGPVNSQTDWRAALDGVGAVIHLAGLLPGNGTAADMYEVNFKGTENLVNQCLAANISKFIYASSIGAITGSEARDVIDDSTTPRPTTDYGRSKRQGEETLRSLIDDRRSAIAIRPPLVYGAKAKGSFGQLLRISHSPYPLPFKLVDNRRSMISVENLASAFVSALIGASPEKSGRYAVCDSMPTSLRNIVVWLRDEMDRPTRLYAAPPILLHKLLDLSGRQQMAGSLFGNLEIDASRFGRTFDWSPPESAPDAIRRSGREFAAIRR